MQALDIVRDAETEMQKATRASDSLREKKNVEMRQKSLKDELLLDIEANQKKKMNLEARIQKLEEQYAPKFDALEKVFPCVHRMIPFHFSPIPLCVLYRCSFFVILSMFCCKVEKCCCE